MADDGVAKQEYHLRNLLTRSVTLYPDSAQIVRDIAGVTLKPGPNEITIYGLAPNADENSIKVDGKGAAMITDMTVDLVPNPDNYDDVYPSDSESSDGSDDEEEEEEEDAEAPAALDVLTSQLKAVKEKLARAAEVASSCASETALLDLLLQKVEKPNPEAIAANVKLYNSTRQAVFDARFAAQQETDDFGKQKRKLEVQISKFEKAGAKEKHKAAKQKAKDRAKKQRVKADKQAAKERLRQERIEFWPRVVYRIVLSLETNSGLTPASSRRGSMDTLVKPEPAPPSSSPTPAAPLDASQVSLCLSYVTYGASWSPRYDLSIATPSSSGSIVYRAEFCNKTSETWRDAKVVLSTSQTSFQGLDDPIPEMEPWHIRLVKGRNGPTAVLYSSQEQNSLRAQKPSTTRATRGLRRECFGLDQRHSAFRPPHSHSDTFGATSFGDTLDLPTTMPSLGSAFQSQQALIAPQMRSLNQPQPSRTLFGSTARTAPGGGAVPPPPPGAEAAKEIHYKKRVSQKRGGGANDSDDSDVEGASGAGSSSLDYQESAWERSGLTATYDVPGLRTIPPSNTNRRHKIATIELKDIALSYVCIPKLRLAAFLKARITNSSGVALLKGPVGLTLDGSFLGNAQLPRCSVGETFPLGLGVDPGITVVYGRPGMKKNLSSGVFSKEDSAVYSRSITLKNTKTTGGAIDLVISDQIPVSEDEKLRVDVYEPRGLKSEGDVAKTGVGIDPNTPASTTAAALATTAGAGSAAGARASVYSLESVRGALGKDEKWGRAVAKVKKAGEVEWVVKLNPGRGVRLLLEYGLRFPGTEGVVEV